MFNKMELEKNTENKKISSGIPNFDKISKGGFEKGSINIIIGGGGSGKSIFATQFLIEGVKKNENVLFISFEEKKIQFYENMEKIGFKLKDLEKGDKFTFIEYTPEKVKTMLEEGGGFVESLILKKKITRVVIDSLTSFIILFENELKQRGAVLTLFNLLMGWGCTTILTHESNTLLKDKLNSKSLEFESDSIIILYFIRTKTERKRYLEILKMRGVNHSKGLHEFEIKNGGIEISEQPTAEKLKI